MTTAIIPDADLAQLRHWGEQNLLGNCDARRLLAALDASRAECAALRAALAGAEAEAHLLRQELDQTMPSLAPLWTAHCFFCGQARPAEDSRAAEDMVREHLATCPRHPLREAEAELAVLRPLVVGGHTVLAFWQAAFGPGFDLSVPLQRALAGLAQVLAEVSARQRRQRSPGSNGVCHGEG